MLNAAEVEKRKDEFDLRPALEFVHRYLSIYEEALMSYLRKPRNSILQPSYLMKNARDVYVDVGPMTTVLENLPKTIQSLSQLATIDLEYGATVPVPLFDTHGNWNKRVDFVPLQEFPRENQHPSRILIGRSTGTVIYPSALPRSVYEGTRERWFYQLHVFIHEVFHTVEYLRRDSLERSMIKLQRGDSEFTFEDWWNKWEELFLSPHPPKYPTRYASVYQKKLTPSIKNDDPDEFTHALAEQICESFVGYILGIVPNDEDNPIFREHSPELWELIDRLCNATLIKM